MRQLGVKKVELVVKNRSDDEMLHIMIAENSTQRGRNTGALMDSVSAITERIAYDLLKYPDFESFKETSNLCTIVQGCKAYDTAKGMLLKGDGLGSPTIRNYAGGKILTERDARTAIAVLKASGTLAEVVKRVQGKIKQELEAERVRQEAEERAQEEALRKAQEELKLKEEAAAKAKEDAEKAELVAKSVTVFYILLN